ncbi:MAG: ATP synthase F1 subunit epsilon [Oscillospiraceae bacterium]|nr:ATP synthase F1 subunit epsilon [Oscillospiraceae bacterium]
MAKSKIHLRVITPDRIKFDNVADMVIMRTTTGDMGILPGHAPYSAALDYGALRILDLEEGYEYRIAVFGGIAEIKDDVLTVVANAAERPEDIDRRRAEKERDKMQRHLQESADNLDLQKDHARLRRMLVRLEVSSYPLIKKHDNKPDTEK